MDDLADFVGLTDVALRRRAEPAHGLFVAEGALVALRALEAAYRPRTLVVSPARTSRADVVRLTDRFRSAGGVVRVDEEGRLREVTGFDVHRGILASFHRRALPSVAEVARGARTLAVLEGIVDHTNVGALLRSAAALGADGVVLDPRCADPLYRRAIRTSMGAVFGVRYARCATWPGGLEEVRGAGHRVLALTPESAATDLGSLQLGPEERVALLLGAEGPGLTGRALAAADEQVSIPMSHDLDSLNVAAAAAVAFWAVAQARVTGSSRPVHHSAGPAGRSPG